MAAYKMAAVNVTPPNDFPLGLIRSHMVTKGGKGLMPHPVYVCITAGNK
jgi:hypothetical protein